ncbi:carbon monoxide dehydrogenase [Pseudonocardia sulfidoxydans NBRC 16205]|uniref:Carbon monoxide dehydrogenase n=1 Tax=Pseudonocardia sulfidoxydans NBRC 16205 TaxID=1223511 RepID=A0A511DRC6_9PSEU|nr:FAD binding domain-containing protein [Pseudonocardia sulfidoxydans]GEL26294.1 carbon monoxide dehydrogenase [Pseudonocardia sulfidoxydans NBRC 16205]
MKPIDFHLHRPTTLAEAIALLAEHGDDAKVLAGGQSLLPLLNFRLARPEHVVDLGRLTTLRTTRRTTDGLTLGAMVTYARAEASRAVAEDAPLLAAALPFVAHKPVRARGTVGGSIAHGDPAAELPAVIRALDAVMVAAGPRGVRRIPAAEFFVGNLVTALEVDEILTGIDVARPARGTGAAFTEVGRRQGDFALVGAGAQVTVADGVVVDVRIALTGIAGVPHRATEAETLLTGVPPADLDLDAAADATRAVIAPSGDLHATADYRRDVAGVLLGRVVATAVERATGHAHRAA